MDTLYPDIPVMSVGVVPVILDQERLAEGDVRRLRGDRPHRILDGLVGMVGMLGVD